MNTKRTERTIGITLLVMIMVMSIFAVMVSPAVAIDYEIGKSTLTGPGGTVDNSLKYDRGDTVYYKLSFMPTSEPCNLTKAEDIFPDGTTEDLLSPLTYMELAQNEEHTWETSWIIPLDWPTDEFTNYLSIEGLDNDTVSFQATAPKTSFFKPPAEPPEFNFTWDRACCRNISFDGWSSDPVNVSNHTWDFGDGSSVGPISGAPGVITHQYASSGFYIVNLTGYNNAGLFNYSNDLIWVDRDPVVIARADPSCYEIEGTDITFDGSDSYADPVTNRTITSWSWTFSDGESGSSDDAPVTSRMVNDTVTATLEVSDGHCNGTGSVTVDLCSQCKLRLYGTFNEGAGDNTVVDRETGLPPENWPYTEPQGPFYPQHWQAPRKDFITFNPAIMEHNDGYDGLTFYNCPDDAYPEIQQGNEKVFKRMWYEKEWFKDHNRDGCMTVVIEKWNEETGWEYEMTMCLADWNAMPDWVKEEQKLRIRVWNNDMTINDSNVDVYGPAIIQEFTYMVTDEETMPRMIQTGSSVLMPMASREPDNGIDSFDALLGDGITMDYVRVESEQTLGFDIDGDGVIEMLDDDFVELSGDETVVFVLPEKTLSPGGQVLQFFDHKVELKEVFGPDDRSATLKVSDNEGGGSTNWEEVTMVEGETAFFYRADRREDLLGNPLPGDTFYMRVVAIGWEPATVRVEVGRMFGQPYANIGANVYWNQKAFMVDSVFYNVVAIKAFDNCIKYITIRQKLPKMPIKLYGKHLRVWNTTDILPELPPFNMEHDILVDVLTWDWWYDFQWGLMPPIPPSQQDKIGDKRDAMPPLQIDYVDESVERRYRGELKEIYYEPEINNGHDELWTLEWFHTYPDQYTAFRLPPEQEYLVTLSWFAWEAQTTIWDGHDEQEPVAINYGDRFKFWYRDCTGPLYIDNRTSSIRLYGTFNMGPGDPWVVDPATGYYPENYPYTHPTAPFYPQHWQAPEKDHMTFNPAIMEHNDGYDGLTFYDCGIYPEVQQGNIKVFKRMWYEKEWFKDHSTDAGYDDNCFTVVIDRWDEDQEKFVLDRTMCLWEWRNIDDWIKVRDQLRIREWNNDLTINDSNVDLYGPAINQEFTYMFVDEEWMPTMIADNSKVLIPMAHQEAENDYSGLNSFDAVAGDGITMDYLKVESEQTLGFDIDGDGILEPMGDFNELSGDETIVLVLPEKTLSNGNGNELMFFDHRVVLDYVSGPSDRAAHLKVWDAEGGDVDHYALTLQTGERAFFHRGDLRENTTGYPLPGANFYIEVVAINWLPDGQGSVRLEVGRMFGQPYAHIATNVDWNQKAFIVDGVFYNVVAIKAVDNCIKYITFRQKLPKMPIKLYGKHLRVWEVGDMLPELPPFNMEHDIVIDVQPSWTRPFSQQDKIGAKRDGEAPLVITYAEEDTERRFRGQLKEIYNESDILFDEYWDSEWFHTYPEQYTAFVLPEGQLYLMTLAWYAPEAQTTIWNGHGDEGPLDWWDYERVKFWYDPADNTDIYINRIGEGGEKPPSWLDDIAEYYDMASHGGNGNDMIEVDEVINAIMDYISDVFPFGPDGVFDKDDLIDYILDFL